mmetsp:Transcript_34502/g.46229  ORF Transcript_34502/g.46229 Transcript_34502/m.46229 type:complete len:149 (-) Transcript_34502:86-532(-)
MNLKATIVLCLLSAVAAFSPTSIPKSSLQINTRNNVLPSALHMMLDEKNQNAVSPVAKSSAMIALSSASAAFLNVGAALAEDIDGYEVTELPPPYIPIFFAILLVGGVGALTLSLGDVMKEEASLGLQSGARAKKERERSRSSYFKNK